MDGCSAEIVAEFNRNVDIDVCLLTSGVGSLGLTLTGACVRVCACARVRASDRRAWGSSVRDDCHLHACMRARTRPTRAARPPPPARVVCVTAARVARARAGTGADRVVIVDPSWNPAVEAQSVDRAYRLGQTRDVVTYRLITCGAIEEKVYKKQVFKVRSCAARARVRGPACVCAGGGGLTQPPPACVRACSAALTKA